jgi:ribosomal protein S18 acetylase RimI-like enzyme
MTEVQTSGSGTLFESYSQYLRRQPAKWAASRLESLQRGLRDGWLTQRTWANASGDVAWAALDHASDRGIRIHALQFGRPSENSLREWMEELDRSDVGPIYAVVGLLEGLEAGEQARVFEQREFRARLMMRMGWEGKAPPLSRPKEVRFREFVPGDRAEFAKLYGRVYDEPQGIYWLQPAPDVPADACAFFDHFVDSAGRWSPRVIRRASLVYEVDGQMVGNVMTSRNDSGICQISGLMVDPDYRNRGIGSELVQCALSVASEAGMAHVELTTILGTDAHRLYRRLGFRELLGQEESLPGYWIRPPRGRG